MLLELRGFDKMVFSHLSSNTAFVSRSDCFIMPYMYDLAILMLEQKTALALLDVVKELRQRVFLPRDLKTCGDYIARLYGADSFWSA